MFCPRLAKVHYSNPSGADGASSVDAADLDDDGDMDILFASAADDTIGWYANTAGVFTTNIVTTAADGVSSVHAVDLNDDTFVDFISASANSCLLYTSPSPRDRG